jgi:hypothetical protein
MRYKNTGYNRLLIGEVYNFDFNLFEENEAVILGG